MNDKPILYGADWCLKTSTLRNYMQSRWVDFVYFNVEKDEAAAQRVRDQYDGKLKFPVVDITGSWLKNPKIPALKEALEQKGLL
jgi:mycoredoxin